MEWEIIVIKMVIILHSQQRINNVLTAFLIINSHNLTFCWIGMQLSVLWVFPQ